MRICTTSIFVIIIYQTYVFTAPVNNSKFGQIADVIINPKWALNDPDSKKQDQNNDPTNTDTGPNNKNDVNDPSITNNDPDDSYNDEIRRPKKNNNKNRRRKTSNNNGKGNNRKQNNTRRNGKYRWYRIVTVDYLLVNLPEYRNHEDEKKIVLIWGDGDKRKIVLNENIDEIPMKNLNNNALIRKKRDYNNTFQLQDKLQNKSVKQHDSRENKKYKLNAEANTNNDHGQKSETQNNILENKQNKQNVKQKKTYKNIEKSGGHNSFEKDLSLIDNLEEDENSMNSSIIDNTNENMKFLNSKNSNKNKFRQIVKKRKHPTNTFRKNQTYRNKLRRPNHAQHLGTDLSNNNSETERSYLKPIKQMPENVKETSTISDDVHEISIKEKADTAKSIAKVDEINTFIDEINSNSVENQIDQNYESYTSSLETKQKIPNFSDIEGNKERDLLNYIGHPLRPKSKKLRKKLSDDNDKVPKIYKQKPPTQLEVNNSKEKGSQQKSNKPLSLSFNKIPSKSNDVPILNKGQNTDITTKIPVVDEIETLMDEMNSNSDEYLDDQNNESSPSSLETKQKILNNSDNEDTKDGDLLNNMRHNLQPMSKTLRKKLSDDNDELPKIYKQKPVTQLETNNSEEKGPQQKSIKPLSLSLNKIQSKSNDVPKLTKGETTTIPRIYEIDTLMDVSLVPTSVTLPNDETELPTTAPLDENKKTDRDSILRKITQLKTVEPAIDSDSDKNRNANLLVPSIPKDGEELLNSSNGNQEMKDIDFKLLSSSIDESLDSHIDVDDSQLQPIDFNDQNAMIMGNTKEISQKPKEDINTSKIPTVIDKNKSSEKSYRKIQSSHTTEETVANNYDEPKNYSETPSRVNPAKEVEVFDFFDDCKNLGGVTMEDSDVKKNENTTPSITKKQKNDLTENNKSIPNIVDVTVKPEIPDINEASNLSDDKPHEQLAYTNNLLNEKAIKENSNDKQISLVPTSVTLPNDETELPTTAPLDENKKTDRDSILRKITQLKTVEPAIDGDSDKNRNANLLVPSIPKDGEELLNSSNGNQEMKDIDFKLLSSSIDESLDSHIDVDDSQLQPIDFNDQNAMIMGNTKEISQKPKEDINTSKIPTVTDKNKSWEKSYRKIQSPHTTEQTVANNYDEPKNYSETPSIVNPAKEVEVFDFFDNYKNLGGVTMEDSDVKKNENTTPSITKKQKNDLTENNKSIPNIVDVTVKPEIPDINEASNLSDDKPHEQLAYTNNLLNEKAIKENSNDKQISLVPTSVTLPNDETELPTTAPLDENKNTDRDSILRKITQLKTVEPAIDGDSDKNRNANLLVPSIPKDGEELLNSSNGNQEMKDIDFKLLSSSIDELLDSHIDVDDSQLQPIDFNDQNAMIMGNTKEISQKPKEDINTSKIPTVIDKNKSWEKSYRKIQSPHTTEQTVANNYDEPKNYSETPSIVNPAKEVEVYDFFDDCKNLGGVTMEDSDVKKNENTTPSITKKQKNDLTENNKSIPNIVDVTVKPEIPDINEASNLSDDKPHEQLAYTNNLLNEKAIKENSNDKQISLVPTSVTLPNDETELPTTVPLDENKKTDRDSILRKITQLKTVEPAIDGDSDKNRNANLLVPSIPKDGEELLNSSNGNQEMKDIDFKLLSSSIDESLDSHIDVDDSQLQPIDFNDQNAMIMGNTKEISQKPKEDINTSKIPTVIDKNKSWEKSYRKIQSPHTTEQTVANNYDEPKNYSETPSIVNPAKEVEVYDFFDDCKNLGGVTMEDSDVKKNENTTPSITKKQKNDLTENNKSIPNIVDVTVKPEIPDINEASNLSDDKPHEQLAYTNNLLNEKAIKENSNDKQISLVPTSVTLPNDETELPTTAPLDENKKTDRDSILRKITQPKTVGPAIDGDSDKNRNANLLVPSIPKDGEELLNSSNGNQEMKDIDFKLLSSSIDESLDSHIDVDDSQLQPIDFNDQNAMIMGNTKEISQKPKEDINTSKIPTVIDKNKSWEKSYRKIQSPHTTEQTVANNYDEPKNYSETPSIVNPAKEVEVYDFFDDCKNLGGVTMEDSDVKKNENTTPSITKKQKNDLTENNKSIPNIVDVTVKPEIPDINEASNLSDDKPHEQLAYTNNLLNEKAIKENSNDKQISLVPTSVTLPNDETELPTTAPLDENKKTDRDSILRKITQPKTVGPTIDGDSDKNRNANLLVPSIPKDGEELLNSSNGNQEMKDIDFKLLSSSIDESLDSHIDVDDSQLQPIDFNDQNAMIMGNTKEISQKPKEDINTYKIPTVIDKNKSWEKSYRKIQSPHTTEQTVANNYDEPKNYSETPSIVNPAKEVEVYDFFDDCKNLGGVTMEDSDVKKNENTTPSITKKQKNDLTENNKSIPNIVDVTVKPEIPDINEASNLSDDKPHEQLAYTNNLLNEKAIKENSNDKQISLVPTSVTLPNDETELPTTVPLDENKKTDRDSILRKITQLKTVEPAIDGDSDKNRNANLLVPSIPKDGEELLNSSNGNQEMKYIDFKLLSSSIDESLDSHIDVDDSQLQPIDFNDQNAMIMGNTKEISQKPKEDINTSKIPTVIDKNKSWEKSYRKIQSPHTTEQTVANNYDEPKNYSETPSIVNPAKEVEVYDFFDDCKNLGGVTMEDSDVKKNENTTPSITKKQKNDLTENNKSIPNIVDVTVKPEIPDINEASNLSDDKPHEQLAYTNNLLNEKAIKENSNDKQISLVPTSVTLPNDETELPTTAPLDENKNTDRDSILRKITQLKTVEPAIDGDSDKNRNANLLVPSIPKDGEELLNSSNGNQEMKDIDFKLLSSSIDESLDSHIDVDDSQLQPTDFNDQNAMIMGNTKEISQKPKEDINTSKIPTIIDKNKSSEKSYRKIQSPHTTEQTVANNYDEPKNYSETPSIVNPAKEVEVFDFFDDCKNLGGVTMEDSNVKKNENTTPSITKKQKNDLTENNKSIPNIVDVTVKPEIPDINEASNLSDDKPHEQLAYTNNLLNEKAIKENSNDKQISLVPTSVTLPNDETELPTTAPLDENKKTDRDSILRKITQPKTVGPAIDGDSDKNRNANLLVPCIPKDGEELLNSSNGNQEMKDIDFKLLSSSIDESLDSHIDVDDSQLQPIDFNDQNAMIMGNTKEISQKPKEDINTSKIPTVIDKNKSSEKSYRKIQSPHTTEQTVANNYDEPKNYSETPSIVNPAKEVEVFDFFDDCKNLGGVTMEDSDVKKNENTTPSITKKQKNDLTENNKSIPNIVDVTVKPEIPDINEASNLSDDKPHEQLAYTNNLLNEKAIKENSNDKQISLVPTSVTLPNDETELPTTAPLDENKKTDRDSILRKITQLKTVEPAIDGDSDKNRNANLLVPSIPKDGEELLNSSNGNQEMKDIDFKLLSSSIDESLDSHIDVDDSQLQPIDFNDQNAMIMGNTKEISQKPKEDINTSKIPTVIDKNKSWEKSYRKIQSPHTTEQTVANNYDEPKNYSETPSIVNPAKEVEVYDFFDDCKNLGGVTMEDSDVKKNENTTPSITKKQKNDLTENNKSIPNIVDVTVKPEIPDVSEASNLSDEQLHQGFPSIKGVSYGNVNDEISNEKSCATIPVRDIFSKIDSRLSSDASFDKNMNIDRNSILHKIIQPTSYESKTCKPISIVDGENGKNINLPIPSIKKSEDEIPKSVLSGNSQNTVSISNSGHKGSNPNSLNSNVSGLDKHILIPYIDEHLWVPNISDIHNYTLLGLDGETYDHGDGETNVIKNYNLNSNDLSENKNKNIPYNQIKQQNKDFLRKAYNNEQKNDENLKEFEKTKMKNDSFFLANNNSKVNTHDRADSKYYDSNRMDKLTKIMNVKNNIYHYTPSIMVSSKDNSPIISDYNLMNEYENPYGYMLPKFSTKYVEGDNSNNNLWETVPPKKSNVFTTHKESESFNNDINQSDGYAMNRRISNHVNNDKKVGIETEAVKNSYDDKTNIDIHNKLYDDFLKKMSEQLFKKIDNIDDKISKFDKSSNNGSYINYNIRSDYPSTKQIISMNDFPNSKPKNENNIEEPDSKTNKSVESLKTVISNKSNDENEIKEFTKTQKDKHRNHNEKLKKHSKHNKHKKKKSLKKNEIIDNDNDLDSHKKYKSQKKNDIKNDDDKYKKNEIINNDSDDDDDNGKRKKKSHKKNYINDDDDDNGKRKKKSHKKNYINDDDDDDDDDDDGKRKKNSRKKNNINDDDDNGKRKKKSHKKNYINDDDDDDDDDDGKRKKNSRKKNNINDDDDNGKRKKKSHKKNYINDDDDGKRKKKSHKKNYINDDDDGKRKKKSHKKNYINDDDDDGKRKKKSHKKNYIYDDDVEITRSKKTDNKKKKKKRENTSPQECNEVNINTSLQISSEDNDSIKGLKMKSKSKNFKKTNSTKSKKSVPKKNSKYKKQLKSFNYTNKEIIVDASDKDSSSDENNYNLKKTYIKTSSNNNQNNALNEKKHKHIKLKHKTHKKPLKTKKNYKYKEIPVNEEDNSSDENNVNLEETYNINITNDDKALKQKKLRHKRLKKMKNIDINIVKDTDNQVLNKDTNTRQGYQFYAFYPQYRYTNPFGKLFY